jgi:Tol biopolymer transport system component
VRWSCLAVGLVGCGFVHGSLSGSTPDAADGPSHDGVIDGPSRVNCYDQWLDDTIQIGDATAITEVNSLGFDRDPWLSADELTIYVSSARTGTSGGGDVWVATRNAIGGTFSDPIEASAFTSTANETKLSISADGKVAVVGSDRPTPTGGSGVDVWESIRASTSDQWPAMNRTNLALVNTTGSDHDPTISADGQHLYLAPDSPSPQHIAMATRTTAGTFGTPIVLAALDSGTGDADPSPTPDERIILFASNRTGSGDVYYATRTSSSGTFGTPRIVPAINTTMAEGDPHLSTDGCRIYFGRNLGNDDWDIYVAAAL